MRKELTKQLLLNFVCTAIFTIVIHRIVATFFYVTLFASAFSAALSWIQAKRIIRRLGINIKEIDVSLRYLFLAVCVLINFGFNATVPINIDRSFSVWMLNQIANEDTSLTESDLKKNAANFFSENSGEISRRISEQTDLGNLSLEKNRFSLTRRGTIIWRLNKLIGSLYGLNEKYSSGN